MFGKSLKTAGKWLAVWGVVKTVWDAIGHIGNVQTLWDMISGAVQYWPSVPRGSLWVATSWWFPLILSALFLALYCILTKAPKHSPPTPPQRRFGVRCGTDLYSDNILTGNIPGRYLHAEITVSPSVSACKAYLKEIKGGNRHWKGQEQLTFEPSEAPDSLSKALFEKIRYNLDVLLLVSTGDIVVCNHSRIWARLPRLNDLFAVRGPYDLTIDIGGENAAGETFSLRFDWTGNYQTSFLTAATRL